MEFILLITGIGLIILVSIDLLSTILLMNGGGKISNFVSRNIWNILFKLSNENARSSLLSKAGMIIIVSLFSTWILLIWLSFGLIYMFDPGSVIDTSTELNTNVAGKFYFVGYTISSLGNGDLKSGSDTWRIFSNVISMYGTFFITLSISYLIPVLSAVIKKRALSGYIYQLGKTPEEILKNGWNGKDFSILYSHLNNLNTMILSHSERHLAYPILHYFHSTRPKYSAPLTLTILDEAISIQKTYKIDNTSNSLHWEVLRRSLASFLEVIGKYDITKELSHPPFSYKQTLENLPINATTEEINLSISKMTQRRKSLHGMVRRDGWQWKDVVEEKP